jgi:hypothetical protein
MFRPSGTSSISLLQTDSRSVESSRDQLLAIKAITRQNRLQGAALGGRSRLEGC